MLSRIITSVKMPFAGGGAESDCLGFMQIQSLDLLPELENLLWYFYTLKHKAQLQWWLALAHNPWFVLLAQSLNLEANLG